MECSKAFWALVLLLFSLKTSTIVWPISLAIYHMEEYHSIVFVLMSTILNNLRLSASYSQSTKSLIHGLHVLNIMECGDPKLVVLLYPSRTLVHVSFLVPALGVQVLYESKHTLLLVIVLI